ncbi:DUF3137 domain-containing protein [Phytoactinopolyspora limicola]|uniref:DUF3137 domain-containing protein n=1 Tax=Phytoactinopolyspora limicola TaxID=2715536 RepID=UPI00140C64A6|nr:DUF3137 domain-containing protein [Phytoactinopolyspora limicola]
MESIVALVIVGSLVIGLAIFAIHHHNETKRREALQNAANAHGWQWTDRDDSYASRWDGPPFRGHKRRARARNVLTGTHDGRDFVAFEYSYTTTTSTGQTTSTTTHYYSTWVIYLPASVPSISLGAEGILGGRVAKAFGFNRLDIGDPDFDGRFKVTCDVPEFGRRILNPALVDLMMRGEVWAWRFDGDVMISYRKGRLDPTDVIPRLDAMSRVLEHVPHELWDQYGRPATQL